MKAIKNFLNSLFNKNSKCGELIKVDNKDHKLGENSTYVFVCVKDKGECKSLLFTENEIKNAEMRAFKNPEDLILKDGKEI
jgi:hypothetical protein